MSKAGERMLESVEEMRDFINGLSGPLILYVPNDRGEVERKVAHNWAEYAEIMGASVSSRIMTDAPAP